MKSLSPYFFFKRGQCHSHSFDPNFLKICIQVVFLIARFAMITQVSTSSISDQNDGWKNRYNRKCCEFEKKCVFWLISTPCTKSYAYWVNLSKNNRHHTLLLVHLRAERRNHFNKMTECIFSALAFLFRLYYDFILPMIFFRPRRGALNDRPPHFPPCLTSCFSV